MKPRVTAAISQQPPAAPERRDGRAMASPGLILPPLLLLAQLAAGYGGQQHERVLLRDIQAITLYAGAYTTARRAAPVPQLKCMGGSAGCGAVIPQVVQCYNRGWDGIDAQWECKVEMGNDYRFGKIEVSCEGFDYPEDPYILRGSCGLEYTLELTEEGQKSSQGGSSWKSSDWSKQDSSSNSGIITFLIILGLAYGVYKLFLSGPSRQQQHPHPDEYGQEYQNYNQASAPPPPGFKEHFTGASSGFGNFGPASSFGSQATQGPGFWTGLGTGGVLGYLFGNQRARTQWSSFGQPNNVWRDPSFSSTVRGSSGVRTASGFGGTKRR